MASVQTDGRRIVLLGDGQWAVTALRHLQQTDCILRVVGRKKPTDACLSLAASEFGLPLEVLADVNSPDSMRQLFEGEPDLLLSVSYDQIFSAAFLRHAPPVLNLHAGHPSRVRGRAVLTWQLLEGRREIDLVLMRVSRGVDSGPVVASRQVRLASEDGYDRALEACCEQVPPLLDDLPALSALPGPDHEEEVAGGDTPAYYPRRMPGDEWLDWTQDSDSLLRKIRALRDPNPGARTCYKGSSVRILQAMRQEYPSVEGIPGSIVGRSRKGVLIKTGDGALLLTELRDETGVYLPWKGFKRSERFLSGLDREVASLRARVAGLEALVQSLGPDQSDHDQAIDHSCGALK